MIRLLLWYRKYFIRAYQHVKKVTSWSKNAAEITIYTILEAYCLNQKETNFCMRYLTVTMVVFLDYIQVP